MISSSTNGIERLKIGGDTVDKSVSHNNSNNCSSNNCNNGSNSVHRDGNYYLKQLSKTRERLVRTAEGLDKELEELLAKPETPEDVIGTLRSASGKARLLSAQKIKQFEDLCHKNLVPPPDDPFPTKLEDLEGFWDMVMLQVDECDATFARIDKYRTNGWRIPEETDVDSSPRPAPVRSTPGTKRPSVPRINSKDGGVERTPTSIMAAKKREEQRQKMVEMKRQYKLQQEQLKNKTAAENGTNNDSSENIIINQ